MKPTLSIALRSSIAAIFCAATSTALATGQVSIGLQATGTISAAPAFKDSNGTTITNVDFNFDNNLAGNATRDIDSQAYQFKLVGAPGYPASVDLVTPGTCTIGTNSVNNGHVQFSHAGVVATANGSFNIADASLASYFLRFDEAGNYGDKSGAVTCAAPGSLTFTY